MKKLISLAVLGLCVKSFAYESKMNFSMADLKKNALIVGSSGNKDDQIAVSAVRVLQLQLEASKCTHVRVDTKSMYKAAAEYEFTVTSDNCVMKAKKNEYCDSGFEARNISPNQFKTEDVIVGEDDYKVCLKMDGAKPDRPFDLFRKDAPEKR